MYISGKQSVYVKVEPLEALQELMKEFLGIENRRSGANFFKREVKEHNEKNCIMETREIFGHNFEEIVYKELSSEEYEYYLALKKVIEYHERKNVVNDILNKYFPECNIVFRKTIHKIISDYNKES